MPRVLSWYPWSPADYRADTRHLTRTQHYAYRETLDEIFLSGQDSTPPSIPDDDELLRDLWRVESEKEYRAFRAVLIDGSRAVLVSKDGRISQKRMSLEIAKGLDVRGKRQKAAAERWFRRTETARQGENGTDPVPEHGENGNGHATMSDKQFLFYAGRVGKWLDSKRELYHGSDTAPGSAFARDFQNSIGISWQKWQKEQAYHQ